MGRVVKAQPWKANHLSEGVPPPPPYAGYVPDLNTLRNIIQLKFNVIDSYIDPYGIPSFVVTKEPAREKFKDLVADLSVYGLFPTLRKQAENLVVRVFQRPQLKAPRRLINVGLFLATLATILFASYSLTYGADPRLLKTIFTNTNLNLQVGMLAVSIFGIIGLHESGHKVAARMHGLDSTLPYFIPGPPPFGTFGAVISLRAPPTNKDELFDLGFSGPFVGFLATVAVALLGFLTAPVVPAEKVAGLVSEGLLSVQTWPRTPLLIVLFGFLGLRAVPEGYVLVLTQISFAAEVGALITFLNILPVWQLDGGHISRAIFGRQGHRVATFIGLGVLFLTGYWFFAFFLLLMMLGRKGLLAVEPLDDISPLSASRRGAFLLALAMFALTFVIF